MWGVNCWVCSRIKGEKNRKVNQGRMIKNVMWAALSSYFIVFFASVVLISVASSESVDVECEYKPATVMPASFAAVTHSNNSDSGCVRVGRLAAFVCLTM